MLFPAIWQAVLAICLGTLDANRRWGAVTLLPPAENFEEDVVAVCSSGWYRFLNRKNRMNFLLDFMTQLSHI